MKVGYTKETKMIYKIADKMVVIYKGSLFALAIMAVICGIVSLIRLNNDVKNWDIEIVSIDNQEIKDTDGNAYININNKYTKIEPAVIDNSGRLVTKQPITDKVYRTKDGSYYLVSDNIAYKLQADGKDLKYNKDAKLLEYTENGQTTIVMNLKTLSETANRSNNTTKEWILIFFIIFILYLIAMILRRSDLLNKEVITGLEFFTALVSIMGLLFMAILFIERI